MNDRVSTDIDLLTGAYRKDAFEAHLARALSLAKRRGEPLSLVWIDVDDLCEHNDLHGRDRLDATLGWLAARISALVDGQGPIGRVQGGAFAVFLPGVGREKALRLSQELRAQVPQTLHASSFGDFRLTISVGVATLRAGEPWGNFLEAAETACRNAKQGGRDMVAAR